MFNLIDIAFFYWENELKKMKQNILRLDSAADVVDFVKNVESENSDKISEMIRNDVDMFFDIGKTLSKIKDIFSDEDVSAEVNSVMILLLELHQKLLLLENQNLQHHKLISEMFNDSKLIYHVIKENKDVII